jgi:hypothetical protein
MLGKSDEKGTGRDLLAVMALVVSILSLGLGLYMLLAPRDSLADVKRAVEKAMADCKRKLTRQS